MMIFSCKFTPFQKNIYGLITLENDQVWQLSLIYVHGIINGIFGLNNTSMENRHEQEDYEK
jgi:hypothetical protein